eukprot:GHVQ01037491.1.p1 GENE.GHVQ01037491.1~~GHVQ01037491.1.p1  ORF type:complete len:550 (-),score=69.96 GHVQ01037491.1:3212-4861(-)
MSEYSCTSSCASSAVASGAHRVPCHSVDLPAVLFVTDSVDSLCKSEADSDASLCRSIVNHLRRILHRDGVLAQHQFASCVSAATLSERVDCDCSDFRERDKCECEFVVSSIGNNMLPAVGTNNTEQDSGGGNCTTRWSVRHIGRSCITTKYYTAEIAFWHCTLQERLYTFSALPSVTSSTGRRVLASHYDSSPSQNPCPFAAAFYSPSCVIHLCNRSLDRIHKVSSPDFRCVMARMFEESLWISHSSDGGNYANALPKDIGMTNTQTSAANWVPGGLDCPFNSESESIKSRVVHISKRVSCCSSSEKDETGPLQRVMKREIFNSFPREIDVSFAVFCIHGGTYKQPTIHNRVRMRDQFREWKAWAAKGMVEVVVVHADQPCDGTFNNTTVFKSVDQQQLEQGSLRLKEPTEGEGGLIGNNSATKEGDGNKEEMEYDDTLWCSDGLDRIAEALEANFWSNAVLRDRTNKAKSCTETDYTTASAKTPAAAAACQLNSTLGDVNDQPRKPFPDASVCSEDTSVAGKVSLARPRQPGKEEPMDIDINSLLFLE